MARRLTRKQIKQDEFVTFMDRVAHWISGNWRQAAIGIGGAIAIGLIYWGVTAFLASRRDAASRALVAAVEVYQAPVGDAAPANGEQKFATEAERLTAAQAALEKVASKYSLTPQARVARLYLASIAAEQGDSDKAARLLGEIAERGEEGPLARVATLDLMRLRIARGETDQLVPELEAMIAGKDSRLPRDMALFQLAELRRRQGKSEEAATLYKKLIDDFSESPYVYEARQRMSAAQ